MRGRVHQETRPAFFAENQADPVCMYRNGKYYFLATNDADGNRTLYMRCADTREGGDILDPASWTKSNYPLMSSSSAEGQYGPGHNSYVTDENGLVWNFYHMRAGLDAPRSSAVRRVHFDIDGEPMLDVTEEYDLPEAYRQVEAALEE